jgi:nucleoside phosphorylase
MEISVLILTPLPVEFNAVARHMENRLEPVFKDAAAYEQGTFVGRHHRYRVVVREPGMKNVDMALATERAIQHFDPQIVLLLGIAGGVKDLNIGDVIIARRAYGYESGKEDADGYKSRPTVESFSAELLARAQVLSRQEAWKARTLDGAPSAKILLGSIAAGDKVVAGTDNPTFQRLKTHYNDTLALEMEAIGFATAIQNHRHVHGVVVRGISDLCAGKSETDLQNWQPVAADRAASVGFELLWNLDGNGWLTPSGDSTTRPLPPAPGGIPDALKAQLRQLVAAAHTKEALDKYIEYAEQSNQESLLAELLQLKSRHEELARKLRLGIIGNSEANVERSQIVAALVDIIR